MLFSQLADGKETKVLVRSVQSEFPDMEKHRTNAKSQVVKRGGNVIESIKDTLWVQTLIQKNRKSTVQQVEGSRTCLALK